MSSVPDSRSPTVRPAPRGGAEIATCLLIALLLTACAPTLRLGPVIDDPARIKRLKPRARSPFPEQASILNEARVLFRGNLPTFFTGQIWYRAPDRLRVQAYSEMGVVLLDILAVGDRVQALTSLPGRMGDPRLARGMARDLALLFLLRPAAPPFRLCAVAEGGWDLVTGPEGERVVFRFPAEGDRPTAIIVEENGSIAARLDLAAWTEFGPRMLPSRIDLTRPALRYTLSLDVVEVHPLSGDERPFRAEGSRAE